MRLNQSLSLIDTPAIIIDEAVVRRNIKKMISGLKANDIAHRPHFKTHKSLYFAKMQMEMGAAGITCATIGEAEILINGGITDIFIAYPIVGEIKVNKLVGLARRASLRTAVNSIEGARELSGAFTAAGMHIKVLIELEGGMGRSGINLNNILEFARAASALPGLSVTGVMTFHGNINNGKSEKDYISDTKKESAELLEARRILSQAGIACEELSGGSSFSSKFPQYLRGITEARAGTYIFNDVSQLATGLVTQEECALTVLTTVVTRPDINHAVIDAGSKTFSSDVSKHGTGFGAVLGFPDAVIHKFSEEHGYLRQDNEMTLAVGERIRVIPNHVCTAVNLADFFWVINAPEVPEGEIIRLPVDARGKNQ